MGCNRWQSLRVTAGCPRLPNLLITHEITEMRRRCFRRSLGSGFLNVRNLSQSASNASRCLARYLQIAAATRFHRSTRNPTWGKPAHRVGTKNTENFQRLLHVCDSVCSSALASSCHSNTPATSKLRVLYCR